MLKIDKSTLGIDEITEILELGGGTFKGFSHFVGREGSYYWAKLRRDGRYSQADIAKLEQYLTHIGGKTTFEDAYRKMIANKR